MKKNVWNGKPRSDRAGEAGQAIIFVLLVLGFFFLGALCFAFDLSNIWFHRQSAQSAADAACAAGAMDILVDAQGDATGQQGFTLGTNYSCTTTSTDTICKYAAKNGYNASSTLNTVGVSFPNSVTQSSTLPTGVVIPPAGLAGSYPFIRVDIVDHVQTFFVGLFSCRTTQDVATYSSCCVELATAPIPLVVLDPRAADAPTLQVQGTPVVAIYGGPQQSIQVNSRGTTAVSTGGTAKIDLSQGGPNITGSDLGASGIEAQDGGRV